MATAAHTTGVDAQAEELRRRNVATQSNAGPVVAEAPLKEKSKEKVRLLCRSAFEALSKLAHAPTGEDKLTIQQAFDIIAFLDEYEFIWAPLIFTFFAFFTRMYKIGLSPIVTWDEAQ
jgi:dolichyl-phosphate-mannose-protein mannosyltransferase